MKKRKPPQLDNNSKQIADKSKIAKAAAARIEAYQVKPGEVRNPAGRPKGSRNKFAEAFVQDFLADWEINGAAAIRHTRLVDPAAYLRVASSLLPKEFNINDERVLEKFLEQYSDKELDQLIAGIASLGTGAGVKQGEVAAQAGGKSTRVH